MIKADITVTTLLNAMLTASTRTTVGDWNIGRRLIIAIMIPVFLNIIYIHYMGMGEPLNFLYLDIFLAVPIFLSLVLARWIERAIETKQAHKEVASEKLWAYFKKNNFVDASVPQGTMDSWLLSYNPTGEHLSLNEVMFASVKAINVGTHNITVFRQNKIYYASNGGQYFRTRWIVTLECKGKLPDIILVDPLLSTIIPPNERLALPADAQTRYGLRADRAYGMEVYEVLSKEFIETIDSDSTPHHIELVGHLIIFELPLEPTPENELPQIEATVELAKKIALLFGETLDRISYTEIGNISPLLPKKQAQMAVIGLLAPIMIMVLTYNGGEIRLGIPHVMIFIALASVFIGALLFRPR